jgi:phage I-like protein
MGAYLKAFSNKVIDNHALDDKELPKKLKILNWGLNETNDGNVYLTDESLRVFDTYQKRAGRDKAIAIDFDHCTVAGSKEYVPGQPKSIAGYGDPVIVKGDGLYLYNVEWTPLGKKNARNYKDLSPAAVLDNKGIVLGLDSVGLTPHGAVSNLNFFSSTGFDNKLLTEMSANNECNKEGANPNTMAVEPDKDDYDEHDVDCKCASCMAAEDPAVHKKHLEEYDSEDHYSKYGDVEYADKENHKYPIDTKAHAKAALAYISMPKNAKKYSGDKLSAIKSRIRSAAEKHGVEVADKTTKTMSADNPSYPDAYQTAIENPYKNMNTTVLKKMAAEVGMDGESDQEKVLFAFLAKFEGLKAELAQQITKKGNTEEGGLKQFSAEINNLKQEIVSLKNQKAAEDKENDASQRAEIERLAAREGKVIPLSADERKNIDINLLRSIVKNQPRSVPTVAHLRTLSVQDGQERKPSREKAVAAFESMLVK